MPAGVPEIGFLVQMFEAVDAVRPFEESGRENGVVAAVSCRLGL